MTKILAFVATVAAIAGTSMAIPHRHHYGQPQGNTYGGDSYVSSSSTCTSSTYAPAQTQYTQPPTSSSSGDASECLKAMDKLNTCGRDLYTNQQKIDEWLKLLSEQITPLCSAAFTNTANSPGYTSQMKEYGQKLLQTCEQVRPGVSTQDRSGKLSFINDDERKTLDDWRGLFDGIAVVGRVYNQGVDKSGYNGSSEEKEKVVQAVEECKRQLKDGAGDVDSHGTGSYEGPAKYIGDDRDGHDGPDGRDGEQGGSSYGLDNGGENVYGGK